MVNRWIGIACVAFMLSANATLFVRDVLPAWLAGDPPMLDDLAPSPLPKRQAQIGIFDERGENVGRSWTITERLPQFLTVTSSTMLNPILLPNGMVTPQVRIDTSLKYREDDHLLEDLRMSIRGLPVGVVMRGELVPPDEFVCEWRLGAGPPGRFTLDADATRAMGDVVRPFTRLPGLYVGRTWRLQLLDPLSRIIPGFGSHDLMADAELVRVTRTETITHRGEELETFVVEARRTRAWVTPQGDVLRQEVDLPLLGRLTLRDELFDENAYDEARNWLPADEDQE